MTLREEIEQYREPVTRGVSPHRNPNDHSCDNLTYYTSQYMILALRDSITSPSEIEWYVNFIRSCMKLPGLLVRYPGDMGDEAHDNPIGVIAGCYAYRFFPVAQQIIQDIYNYGLQNGWCYNSAEPGKWRPESYFERFPDFVPYLKCALGLKLSPWDQIKACSGFLFSAFFEPKDDTSGKCLQWLKSTVFRGRYRLIDAAIKIWEWRLFKTYPEGMHSVFGVYFGTEHPLAKYARRDFR